MCYNFYATSKNLLFCTPVSLVRALPSARLHLLSHGTVQIIHYGYFLFVALGIKDSEG